MKKLTYRIQHCIRQDNMILTSIKGLGVPVGSEVEVKVNNKDVSDQPEQVVDSDAEFKETLIVKEGDLITILVYRDSGRANEDVITTLSWKVPSTNYIDYC